MTIARRRSAGATGRQARTGTEIGTETGTETCAVWHCNVPRIVAMGVARVAEEATADGTPFRWYRRMNTNVFIEAIGLIDKKIKRPPLRRLL